MLNPQHFMLFFVSVPVLSDRMNSTLPSSSFSDDVDTFMPPSFSTYMSRSRYTQHHSPPLTSMNMACTVRENSKTT